MKRSSVPPATDRKYRSDIDGLRSLAILSVVLYHAGVKSLPGGFTGVDIFFAISGYLIGGHIYADLQRGTFRFANFYQRRAKRILPPLFVMLAALLLICCWLFSPYELRQVGSSAAATIASVSNILFARGPGYFSPQTDLNPLLMTWSLGVEEQFYLLVPLLLVWLCRLRPSMVLPAIALLAAISFGFAWYQLRSNPTAAFYLLPSRAWELALGVALAILEAQRRSLQRRAWQTEVAAATGLLLLLAPICLLRSTTPFPGPAALPSVAGCVLLIATRESRLNRTLLSLQPLVFIGRVSYSWYLWHWPLLALLRAILGQPLSLGWGLTAIAVAFGLAVLSFYFVERPFRSSKLAAVPLLWRYAAVSCLFFAISVTIWCTDGLPSRYPAVAGIDAARLQQERNSCLAAPGETAPRTRANCAPSAPLQNQVALWGDSHAAALAPALREAVSRSGYGLQVYAKMKCAPLTADVSASNAAPVQDCATFNGHILRRLTNDPRVQVVALQAFWQSSILKQTSVQSFRTSLERTIDALQHAGKQVIVFGDVPTFAVDPLWRMRTGHIASRRRLFQILQHNAAEVDPGSDRADDLVTRTSAPDPVRSIAAERPDVHFWDLTSHLCSVPETCLYAQHGTPLYIDGNHITLQGGQLALQGWTPPKPSVP